MMVTSVAPEPHLPHVLIENGDMTLDEYDEYLRGRGDFVKATKKDSSNKREVSQAVIPSISHTARFHTLVNNPVKLMLRTLVFLYLRSVLQFTNAL